MSFAGGSESFQSNPGGRIFLHSSSDFSRSALFVVDQPACVGLVSKKGQLLQEARTSTHTLGPIQGTMCSIQDLPKLNLRGVVYHDDRLVVLRVVIF